MPTATLPTRDNCAPNQADFCDEVRDELRSARAVLADIEAGSEPIPLIELGAQPFVCGDGPPLHITTAFRWKSEGLQCARARGAGGFITTRKAYERFARKRLGRRALRGNRAGEAVTCG